MLVNLLELETSKVSKNIKDYSMLITAESGMGKTPFALELYGKERTLLLAFEDSAKGIADAFVVKIDNYSTLEFYLNQLCNPEVRKKFDNIIVDTLFHFDYMCEQAVCDSYGVKIVKDALAYNAGYKIIDKNFLSVLKKIQKMGYNICYVAHPTTKKLKNAQGVEYQKIVPRVSDRVANLLLPEIDIKLFVTYDEKGERVIYTQNTPYFDARCRVSKLPPVLPFDAKILTQEFEKGVELLALESSEGAIVDNREKVIEVEPTFEELLAEINDLGAKAFELGRGDNANRIVLDVLGYDDDSNPRGLDSLTPEMLDAMKVMKYKLMDLIK